MTREPAELLRRAREAPAEVGPAEFARTLRSSPRDASIVGEALIAFDDEGSLSGAVGAIADCLDDDDVAVRRGGAQALRDYVNDRPEVDGAVVSALATALTDEDRVVCKRAGVALASVAQARPAAVTAAVDRLPAALDPDRLDVLAPGLNVAAAVAETDPEAAVPLLDPLFDALVDLSRRDADGSASSVSNGAPEAAQERHRQYRTEIRRQQGRIVDVIVTVLVRNPESVESVLDPFVDALECEEIGAHRGPLAEAVGHVAEEVPNTVSVTIEPLAGLLDEDDSGVRTSAAWSLGMLADSFGERVADASVEHVESLITLLETDTRRARVAGANLLGYVGEFRPGATRSATDALVELLDEDDPEVRVSATLALGHVGGTGVVPALSDVTDDPDETVRAAAERAIERIENSEGQ